MSKGLLDYLTDDVGASQTQEPTFETIPVDVESSDSSVELIESEDKTFIKIICTSYIESYESGELTFDTTVKLAWTFLDDYEPHTEDADTFHAYKSEILYELLEHLVTLKPPPKGVTMRTRIGTPPPKLKKRITMLVDGLIARNNDLRKLPVETDTTDSIPAGSVNRNVFDAAAERLQKWGFPNTTAKMVYDSYYDKSSKI